MGWHALARVFSLGIVGPAKPDPAPLAPGPTAATIGRTNPDAAPTLLGAPTPPDATEAASTATLAAQQAADKARKRAAAGSTLLTGGPVGAPYVPAVMAPRTLIGS